MKIEHKKLPNGAYLLIYTLSADGILPNEIQISADGTVPNEIQLLPYGEVHTAKGNFLVDEQAIAELMANFAKKKNDKVVDYEHQTLTGKEAPAAGWVKTLINRGKDGLWGWVEWTPKAIGYLQNKEYRYLSPVILVRKSDRRPIIFHSAALTNDPAIDGMEPIVNSLGIEIPESEDLSEMEFLKKLALKLGLKETATEEEVMQAIVNLQTSSQIVANKEVLCLLGLTEKATLDEAKGKIAALKNPAQAVANKEILALLDLSEVATLDETKGKIIALKNPSGYVKAEEFKALKDKLDLKERDELVNLALNSGKITPAQKTWAEAQALKDPAGFKAFLEAAPRVVPLDKLPVGDPPAKDPAANDEVQMSVNKMLGVSEEDFKKYNS